jgi:hypothetical protein
MLVKKNNVKKFLIRYQISADPIRQQIADLIYFNGTQSRRRFSCVIQVF